MKGMRDMRGNGLFTPEELEEIRRADREIEREMYAERLEKNKAYLERRKLKLKKKTQNHRYYLKSQQRRIDYGIVYYAEHREEVLQKTKERYQKNKKRILKKKKKYREEHREELRQKARNYYAANREAIREKQQERRKKNA